MKSIFSLRFRERSEFTQVVLQKCTVTATNKSHLKTWLFMAIFFLGTRFANVALGQCSGPNVSGEQPVDVTGEGQTLSLISIVTAPTDSRVECINVRYIIHYPNARGSSVRTYLRSDETDKRYLLKSSHNDGSDDVTVNGITAFEGEPANQIWWLHAYNYSSANPWITIAHWGIEVYYRDPYPQKISVSPMSHDFRGIGVGKTSEPLEITISNTGEQDLNISNITLLDLNFTLDVNGGSNPLGSPNPTINEGHSGTVTVTFNPKSEGTFDTQLKIFSDDPDNSIVTVSLKGRTPQKIFVDSGATGSNDGSSWANAYNYLQDALDFAVAEDEICLAEGIYKPDANTVNPNGTGDREATFQLKSGVAIYGGFPSGGATWQDRNPNTYKTILSGDVAGNDVDVADPSNLLTEPTRAENSYHVVTGTGTSAVLDGFTITAGNASGYYPNSSGGGMCNWGSPTVANCTFWGNSASDSGGGMYNVGSPTVAKCTFRTNSASKGGGMFNDSLSEPTLTNCTFWGNLASGYGGGVYSSQSSESLTNCAFIRNSADAGGAIGSRIGRPTAVNCTFVGNSANRGNALACDPTVPPGNLQVVSCILWNGGDEIWNDGGSTITITYSDVQGSWPGEGNIDADPCFVDPSAEDYHLMPGSPCIDAGDNSAVPVGITTDLDGKPRFSDDPNTADTGNGTLPIVDMGAYEFQGIICDFCGANSDQPDGCVDYWDLLYFARRWHTSPSDNNWDPRCDLAKEDNYVDYWDLLVFAQCWHKGQKP